MNNYAILKSSCPFYSLFEGGRVPIKNIVLPGRAEGKGDGVQDVYMVDLDKLPPAQFLELARMVQQQCDPDSLLEECMREMREKGLPLRAKHVQFVTSDVPFFL